MSGQSLMLFVFSVAIALAANQAENIKEPATRGPASVSGKKLAFANVSAIKHTMKVHGPIDVNVELVGAPPSGAGDVFVLRGVVQSSEALNEVEYSWRIPQEIEVVNGSLSSVIPALQPDQPVTVEVTLKQKGFANGRIHFRAKASSSGTRFADIAQYNSMTEEALQAAREKLKRSTEEDFAAQKALSQGAKNLQFEDSHAHSPQFKIFH